MEFKDKVKAVRRKLLITQGQLASAIGCTRQCINRWEQGHKKPCFILEAKFDNFCADSGIAFAEVKE